MVCKYKRIIIRVEKRNTVTENVEIYAINTHIKTREKHIFEWHMQVDTGSDITLILRNVREKMCKPKKRKKILLRKQFDEAVI